MRQTLSVTGWSSVSVTWNHLNVEVGMWRMVLASRFGRCFTMIRIGNIHFVASDSTVILGQKTIQNTSKRPIWRRSGVLTTFKIASPLVRGYVNGQRFEFSKSDWVILYIERRILDVQVLVFSLQKLKVSEQSTQFILWTTGIYWSFGIFDQISSLIFFSKRPWYMSNCWSYNVHRNISS